MRSRSRSEGRGARRGDNYKRGRSQTPPERRYDENRSGGRDRWADERGYRDRDERPEYRRRDDSRDRNRRGDSRERRRDERNYDRRDDVRRTTTSGETQRIVSNINNNAPSLPQIAVAQPPPPPPPPPPQQQQQQQQQQQMVPSAPAPAPSYSQQPELLDWHNATQVYDALCKTDEWLPPGWECVVYKGVPVYLDHLSREAFEDKPWEVWARKSSKAAASAGPVGVAF
ncbi:Hypothetical protein, putative [Bodo saltans]|uniref:WW domain-containing protein n=1 Tax=Bodo saltans TaxID=75058 RepID=A0A0S4JIN5_BODSA|nr:Hypothetical protein, putative [Bodo saltans]|eukprot:CUG90028.1 Hypothetical protein, putative [Bodo saltans]